MCITPFGIDFNNDGIVSWEEDYLTYDTIRSGISSDDSSDDYSSDYSGSYSGYGDSYGDGGDF